jgi:hypothetical protein
MFHFGLQVLELVVLCEVDPDLRVVELSLGFPLVVLSFAVVYIVSLLLLHLGVGLELLRPLVDDVEVFLEQLLVRNLTVENYLAPEL